MATYILKPRLSLRVDVRSMLAPHQYACSLVCADVLLRSKRTTVLVNVNVMLYFPQPTHTHPRTHAPTHTCTNTPSTHAHTHSTGA